MQSFATKCLSDALQHLWHCAVPLDALTKAKPQNISPRLGVFSIYTGNTFHKSHLGVRWHATQFWAWKKATALLGRAKSTNN